MKQIYFDNAATTRIRDEVIEAMTDVMKNNFGNPSAKGFLDYIEILGTKRLNATDKQFSFRNTSATNTNLIYQFQIQNSSNIYEVWDVSNSLNPKSLINQSSSTDFSFKSYGGMNKEYIVVHPTDFLTPEAIPNNFVENQNLHKLKDIIN